MTADEIGLVVVTVGMKPYCTSTKYFDVVVYDKCDIVQWGNAGVAIAQGSVQCNHAIALRPTAYYPKIERNSLL